MTENQFLRVWIGRASDYIFNREITVEEYSFIYEQMTQEFRNLNILID